MVAFNSAFVVKLGDNQKKKVVGGGITGMGKAESATRRQPIATGVKSTNMSQRSKLDTKDLAKQSWIIAKMCTGFIMRSWRKRILGFYKTYRMFRGKAESRTRGC